VTAEAATPAAVTPLLSAQGLVKHFTVKRTLIDAALGRPAPRLKAVDGVSFALLEGQTLGLVGESGCGKSTLGRTLVGLMKPADSSP
jgi:ABC-type oligopeptide transport system ATPase subunit